MKRAFLIIVFVITVLVYKAQDYHFSQFNENPSLVNPALTGLDKPFRASLVYKNQWRSVTVPYQTYGFSFESKFKPGNWETVDSRRSMTFKKSYSRMAGGLSMYKDNAGDGNLSTFQTNASLSMLFPFNKNHSLSFGLQGSISQKKLNSGALLYPNQYNGTTYDANVLSGENNISQVRIYPEFSSGLAWVFGHEEKTISSGDQLFGTMGFSVYHINKPRVNFTDTRVREYRKFVTHGCITIGINNTKLAVVPSWLLQFQGPSKEIIAGGLVKYYFKEGSKYTGINKKCAFGFGGYYRNYDAVVASVTYDGPTYSIGFNYDTNISGLSTVSKTRGGIEINLKFFSPSAFLYQRKSKKSSI